MSLTTDELLGQLGTRFRITADLQPGQPPLDIETSLFAVETVIPGPEFLGKMLPGSSWTITRLDDDSEGAANGR